ncbi:MAG: TPM domain-containing protein [Bacillota bacterium]
MKKITRALLVLLLLALPFSAMAKQRVYDYAQIFTTAQEQAITDAVEAFIEETGMDYAVVTISETLGSQTDHTLARSYYRSLGLGAGDDASGALYTLNMYAANRYEYLYTDGKMIQYMTDVRVESALDQSNPKLRQGLYAEGALAMLAAVRGFVKQGIPEGSYLYDYETGERISSFYKVITPTEMLIGAGACLLIGLGFTLIVSSRYKLRGSTYKYDYYANSGLTMTENTDQYLRTTVTRTRRVQTTGGHGGGGGGGGGGSGVHSGGGGGGGRGF